MFGNANLCTADSWGARYTKRNLRLYSSKWTSHESWTGKLLSTTLLHGCRLVEIFVGGGIIWFSHTNSQRFFISFLYSISSLRLVLGQVRPLEPAGYPSTIFGTASDQLLWTLGKSLAFLKMFRVPILNTYRYFNTFSQAYLLNFKMY